MQGAEDDFASRYADGVAQLFEHIDCACAGEPTWPLGVHAAIRTVLEWLAANPDLAHLLLLEPYAAGGDDRLRHEATLARLAQLMRGGRDEITESMPEMVEEGLIGGALFLVGRPLRAGSPELLPALAPELTAFLLAPYLGREEAERIAGV